MIRTCTAGPAGIVMTRNIGAWADHDQGIKKNVVGLHSSITSYSNATPSGSFSLNHSSASSAVANTLR